MQAVYDYIYARDENVKEIMLQLHEHFIGIGLQPKIRFGLPMYYQRTWLCYLNPKKTGGVELVFMRGRELSNAHGLLEARGRTQVTGVILRDPDKIPMAAIKESLEEALVLDETSPFQLKKKKGKK